MTSPPFLTNPALRLLLFGGKGGVGKTTSAAASALQLARSRPAERFLLVSTDPAHSVADCLAGGPVPTNLTVVELDAGAIHRSFMAQHAGSLREIATRGTFLDEKDVDQFLDLSLPGIDELMAFLQIATWSVTGEYAVIVVDTAPTGHALRLLQMPEFFTQWLDAMDALLAKHRYMAGLFSRKAPAKSDEVEAFLDNLRELFDAAHELLTDSSRSHFVPVMLGETLSVEETKDLLLQLDELEIAAPDIIVNRLIPADAGASLAPVRDRQLQIMSALPGAFDSRSIWALPLQPDETTGAKALEELFTSMLSPDQFKAELASRREPAPMHAPTRLTSGAATLPSPQEARLLFFAGKGGVGKTTLSCAAGLALAEQAEKDVLLVSVDPAHSLADCLALKLGPSPKEIAPRLLAMEIDAAAQFTKLRDEYLSELEALFDKLFSSADATFDREAMEHLLDLAPPGLDEVMALTMIVDTLDSGRFASVVLDTAPTGHLLRLLQLPHLIEQWLGGIFKVLLKYQSILTLPRLTAKLIKISKGTKRLSALLTDPTATCLFPVAIPTEMALAETKDLVQSCRASGIRLPAVLVNQCTPDEEREGLAGKLSIREARVRKRFEESFPDVPIVSVYRHGPPRGIEALTVLSREAFRPAAIAAVC